MRSKSAYFLSCLAAMALAGCCAAPAAPKETPAPAPAPAPVVKPAEPAQPAAYVPPALSDAQSWTMVVVPDTQAYSARATNNGILDMMFSWMVSNRTTLRIEQVLFTGDLVDQNDRFQSNRRMTASEEQWKGFSRTIKRLDGELPYILTTGNHDYGHRSAENRNSFFGKYFPTDRNPLTRRQLIECAPNAFDIATLQNAAYEFTAPHPDNRKFLVISLQFAPTDQDLAWAKKVADNPRFANHFGIVLTHSYLAWTCERIQQENYLLNKAGGNAGEGIFRKLVYPAKNIRMVVCGHIAKPDDWEKGIAFAMDKNESGKSVAQMAFNTQAIGGGWSGNGGDGWLRLLEFMPDRKTIKARTFSPFFAISPSTRHLAWKHDARSEFTFELEE